MSFAHYSKLGRRDLLDILFSLRFFPSQLISYTRCFYRYLHLYALAQPHRLHISWTFSCISCALTRVCLPLNANIPDVSHISTNLKLSNHLLALLRGSYTVMLVRRTAAMDGQ